jgi:hypothetical protein
VAMTIEQQQQLQGQDAGAALADQGLTEEGQHAAGAMISQQQQDQQQQQQGQEAGAAPPDQGPTEEGDLPALLWCCTAAGLREVLRGLVPGAPAALAAASKTKRQLVESCQVRGWLGGCLKDGMKRWSVSVVQHCTTVPLLTQRCDCGAL